METQTLGRKIGAMDRISELPDFIVHHIFSLIDPWDDEGHDRNSQLVRMSVLSKKWFHLTTSFPVLDLSIDNFTRGLNLSRQCFFKYVEYATSRFSVHNVPAHTFKLSTNLWDHAEIDIVNRCIELVLKNGVRELVIHNHTLNELTVMFAEVILEYRLPNILLSVSMLKSLSIRGCQLPSSLLVDSVKFKSLIKLELENVWMNEKVIKYLTASCPLIRELKIRSCYGFKTFSIYGHQNLQEVEIHYKTPVERIVIEAPNLSYLLVADMERRGAPVMNLASCKKLTTVIYYGDPLPNSNGFTNFLSNFPFVENFCLVTEYDECNLKLSSHSLRTLAVFSKKFVLKELELSTPNLVVFHYFCNGSVFWHPMIDIRKLLSQSTQMKACMHCYMDDCDDALWVQNLRLFLEKKNGLKVPKLYIHAIVSRKIKEFQKLKEIELAPYELKNVEILFSLVGKSPDPVAFVDAVLWCCCPRSLTLRSLYPLPGFKDVAKFTYDKLLEQEDEGHTKIKIMSSETPMKLKDMMSLSSSLSSITFIKEEAG